MPVTAETGTPADAAEPATRDGVRGRLRQPRRTVWCPLPGQHDGHAPGELRSGRSGVALSWLVVQIMLPDQAGTLGIAVELTTMTISRKH